MKILSKMQSLPNIKLFSNRNESQKLDKGVKSEGGLLRKIFSNKESSISSTGDDPYISLPKEYYLGTVKACKPIENIHSTHMQNVLLPSPVSSSSQPRHGIYTSTNVEIRSEYIETPDNIEEHTMGMIGTAEANMGGATFPLHFYGHTPSQQSLSPPGTFSKPSQNVSLSTNNTTHTLHDKPFPIPQSLSAPHQTIHRSKSTSNIPHITANASSSSPIIQKAIDPWLTKRPTTPKPTPTIESSSSSQTSEEDEVPR